MWRNLYFFICLFCLSLSAVAVANDTPEQTDPVHVELIHENSSIQANHPFWVAIRLNVQDGWHSYWKNPGDAGMAPAIEWDLPAGFKASAIEWPYPHKFTLNSTIGYGYEGEVLLLAQITPPKPFR